MKKRLLEFFSSFKKSSADPAHLALGKWGEMCAAQFLKKHRYKIVGQRVFVGRHDELDIIAEQKDLLVFVEVKTRKNELFGRPSSAVNRAKRKNISRAAVNYLRKNKLTPPYIRFDIIEVIGEMEDGAPEIRHIENAFPLDSAYRLWW